MQHVHPLTTPSTAPPAPPGARAPWPALVPALAAAAALAWPSAAPACSVCGCGDPLLVSSDPAAMVGQLRVQLDTEYLAIDAGNEAVPGATDKLTQLSTRLNLTWRPVEDLSAFLTLPFLQKTIKTVGAGPTFTASDLSGLGDVELGARWAFWRSAQVGARRVQELAVSAGSSLPTGQSEAKDAGVLIDPHGQLGTGAWGPFAGLHYRLEQGDWLAFASLSYRVRTEATYFDSSRYKFGDALLWSVHGQYQPSKRWALDLGLDGRAAAADRSVSDTGEVEPRVVNTGGTVLSVAPGAYFNAVGGVWLFARGQIPVYKDLFGVQDVHPSFTLGLQFQVL